MKPVFDENGLAAQAGDVRCFYYDASTSEYTGWSDEYINVGVSMPGNSTAIEPANAEDGVVMIFTGAAWESKEDHRGETVYSTDNQLPVIVDYIGPVRDGFTLNEPTTDFDLWNGDKWVTDIAAQHTANVNIAVDYRQQLINTVMQSISVIQLKLQAGRTLTGTETTKLNAVLDYIDAVNALDMTTAPDIDWPQPPEA